MINEQLYIQDLIEGKEYYQCLNGHNILINKVNVTKEEVHFQYDNKPENGGGVVRTYMNQIECNRYIKKIGGYDYSTPSMENELNYLSEKIESCQDEIDMYSCTRPDTYSQSMIRIFTKEKQLLENILNALTINELK